MRCVIPSLPAPYVAVVFTASIIWAAEPDGAVKDVPQARTDLYNRLDAERIGRRYVSRFEKHAEFNAMSNLKFTPPDRWFKTFRIKGNISAENRRQLLESLQRDLEQLARSGVTDIMTKDSVDERPLAILKMLCPTYTIKVSSIQGCHISYQEEGVYGDIDLIAFQFIDGDHTELQWCVLCAVQEPVAAR